MTGMIVADVPGRILLNMMQRCELNRNSISRRVSSTRERRWMSGSAGASLAPLAGLLVFTFRTTGVPLNPNRSRRRLMMNRSAEK